MKRVVCAGSGLVVPETGEWYVACPRCGHNVYRTMKGTLAVHRVDVFELGVEPPPVRLHLSDEDCWSMSCWNSGPPGRLYRRRLRLIDDRPSACDCGSTALWWNGSLYWCDGCNEPVFKDQAEYFTEAVHPESERPFAVGSSDDAVYREETALYRVPAATNWPAARIRPQTTARREGQPREGRRWRPRRSVGHAGAATASGRRGGLT